MNIAHKTKRKLNLYEVKSTITAIPGRTVVEDDVMGKLVSNVVLGSGSNYEKYSKNDYFHFTKISKNI